MCSRSGWLSTVSWSATGMRTRRSPAAPSSVVPPAILAGVDMLMAPDSWKRVLENTLAEVRSGEIPPARIDDAVRRILRVKAAAGLFKRPAPQHAAGGNFAALGSAAHRALAREAVRKSLVLLKNDHGTLPLNAGGTILVAGAADDSIRINPAAGPSTGRATKQQRRFPRCDLDLRRHQGRRERGRRLRSCSADGQFSSKPDAAIVVFGESPVRGIRGRSGNTWNSPPAISATCKLLRRLKAAGMPTVAVFLSGRPLWVNPEINASDAFVAAWLPGSEGAGVADVLLRAPRQTGLRLQRAPSFSWPRTAMPVTFDAAGNASGAQFQRGFGLGYQSMPEVLAALPEDASIPPHWLAPHGSLFHAGHATAPWSIFVADDTAEVHLTTTRQASPEATVAVELAQDSATGTWTGGGFGVWRFSGRATDLRAQAQQGTTLELRYRVDQRPEKPVKLGMQCAEPKCGSASGALRDLTSVFKSAAPGVWQTMSIPLSDLAGGGADLKDVVIPLSIATSGRFKLSISEARLAPRNESEKRIRARDQIGLENRKFVDSRLQFQSGARRSAARQTQIDFEVPGLGLVQALEQVSDGGVIHPAQGREALARARLDECPANHQIHLALRLALRHQAPQAFRIAPRRQALRGDLEGADQLRDLLVVTQLLARQLRHLVGQLQIFGVGEHQAQGCRCGLFLAIRMIDAAAAQAAHAPARSRLAGVGARSSGCANSAGAGFMSDLSGPKWRTAARRAD